MTADHLEELKRFLPLDISGNRAQAYVDYHVRALNINSQKGIYTFGYFAWHILWMSFLQKVVFYLYRKDPDEVMRWLSSQRGVQTILNAAYTPYDLSEINEKVLCEITRHNMIAFHVNEVKNIKALVDSRDHVAHCSGTLDLSEHDIEYTITRSIQIADKIQDRIANISLANWNNFIGEFVSAENQYSLAHDAIVDYLSREFLSMADIEYILENSILARTVDSDEDFLKSMATLHLALIGARYSCSQIDAENYINRVKQIEMSEEQKDLLNDELVAAGY